MTSVASPGPGKVRRAGQGSALKTYPHAHTERFKCWGSGALNELWARHLLGDAVPAVHGVWADNEAAYVNLEWIEGGPLDPATAQTWQLTEAGRLLARIHSTCGTYWGALDSSHRFDELGAALQARIAVAIRLLASHDTLLADLFHRWAERQVNAVNGGGPPALVHGDYGAANLVWTGTGLKVIDWEFAHWGAPLEDWAMIRFAIRFPQPNSFGTVANLRYVEAGWQEVTGIPPPRDEGIEDLLYAYYAASLGVFFAGRPNHRIEWLRSFLQQRMRASGPPPGTGTRVPATSRREP